MRPPRRDVGEVVRPALSMLLVMAGIVLIPWPASGWQSTLAGITGDGFNPAQALDVVLAPDHELAVVGSNHFVIVKLAAATAPRAVNDFVVRNRTNRFVAEGN